MSTFAADIRAAAVTLLTAYAASTTPDLKLQVYRARPRSVFAPSAFVDRMTESIEYMGPQIVQRTPRVELVVLHGLFDSGDAVDQRDAFADGFLAYVTANVHAGGDDTTVGLVAMEDEPTFVPDWLPQADQKTYYATRLTLEGFAAE